MQAAYSTSGGLKSFYFSSEIGFSFDQPYAASDLVSDAINPINLFAYLTSKFSNPGPDGSLLTQICLQSLFPKFVLAFPQHYSKTV